MNLFHAAIRALGSKRLSVWLLVAGALYTLLLTLLGAFVLKPPAFYMVWSPFVVWAALFLVNLTISLLTRKYVHAGNLIFHAAFLLVAVGIVTSAFFRFEGDVLVIEGDTFYGEEKEYDVYSPPGSFERLAPGLSFRLDRAVPGYWNDDLYFIRLDGEISYPSSSFDKKAVLKLNGGVRVNGARLRIKSYGIFPEAVLRKGDRLLSRGPVMAMIFPPGTEDVIDIGGYRVRLRVFTDPEFREGAIVNRGMEIKEPVYIVKVEWLGREIFRGALKTGEPLKLGDTTVTFTGVRQWIRVGVVKDPGENIVYLGFVLGVIGLVSRVYRHIRQSRGG